MATNELRDALYGVLDTERLDIAKEIAADALGENLEEYLEEDEMFDDLNDQDDVVSYDPEDFLLFNPQDEV